MGVEGLIRKLYEVAEFVTRLMFINLLWILFILVGFGIAGFFPSTAAMFTVIREWLNGKEDTPLFNMFWGNYKRYFLQANYIGFLLLILGLILYIDLRFFQSSDQLLFQLLSFLFFFLLIVYFATLLYIFPVFVHFDYKTIDYIKHSFIMALGRPLTTLVMIIGSILILIVLYYFHILILFIGGAFMSYVLIWIAQKSFPLDNSTEN
ncbi:YesL family protein [Bacillus salitolerans]|uniref:YesL family protein n=1 Tax=Bacillus salitolerans TaxID=1437434 RepID=A0ABW4LL10_9BACI